MLSDVPELKVGQPECFLPCCDLLEMSDTGPAIGPMPLFVMSAVFEWESVDGSTVSGTDTDRVLQIII